MKIFYECFFSIAFLLADRGYNVYLPNSRGTNDSQGYDPSIVNPNSYWNFSWDEIGEFDTPAVVDEVLRSTGKTKVIYIGHSQGNTAMFALLSTKPEYNAKISIFAALAPVVYFSHTESILYVLGNELLPLIEVWIQSRHLYIKTVIGADEFLLFFRLL